jgi:hypothetical protein
VGGFHCLLRRETGSRMGGASYNPNRLHHDTIKLNRSDTLYMLRSRDRSRGQGARDVEEPWKNPGPLHPAALNDNWTIHTDRDPDTWVPRQTYQLRGRSQEEPAESTRDHNGVCAGNRAVDTAVVPRCKYGVQPLTTYYGLQPSNVPAGVQLD